MGFAQTPPFVHFEMEFDKQAAIEIMSREFVHGQSAALGHRTDGLEQRLIARRARFDVDHHVGGHDLRDAILDGFARGVCLLEARRSWNAHGDVHEESLAGATHADALAAQNSIGFAYSALDSLPKAGGGHVEQDVDCLFSEPRTDPDDDARYHESRHRVEFSEPGDAESLAQPRTRDPEYHDESAPDVGGKMQRVCLKRFAGIFFRDAGQRARTNKINSHRESKNHDGGEAGPKIARMEQQSLKYLPDDVERGEKQEARFDERGKALDLAVAVEMLGVRGLVGSHHGKRRDHRSNEVQSGVQGLRENSQAPGKNGQENLQRQQDNSRTDGRKSRETLFLCGFVERGTFEHGDHRRWIIRFGRLHEAILAPMAEPVHYLYIC